jgi:pyridoxine kinase
MDMVEKMKKLVNRADIITPNLTEACLLLGENYKEIAALCKDELKEAVFLLCEKLGGSAGKTVIITGAHEGEYIWNFAADKSERIAVKSKRHGGSFSGTGDLFASVVCAGQILGAPLLQTLQKASDFIEKATKASVEAGIPGPCGTDFEPFLKMLI